VNSYGMLNPSAPNFLRSRVTPWNTHRENSRYLNTSGYREEGVKGNGGEGRVEGEGGSRRGEGRGGRGEVGGEREEGT